MLIKIPHYHIQKSIQSDGVKITEGIWEISVPQKDGIEWSIVLSCLHFEWLKSFYFFEKLGELSGFNTAEKITNLMMAKFYANPFEDRFSLFADENLAEIVSKFSTVLNRMRAVTCHEKLEATRNLLGCSILMYRQPSKPLFLKHKDQAPEIIVFVNKENESDIGFGLTESYCLPMREDALKRILVNALNDHKTISEICTAVKTGEHFLIAVLKSDFKRSVINIYSSLYIVLQLVDAGYDAYPTTEDREGYSPFYYAITSKDSELYLALYHFAINAPCRGNNSYRNPNVEVLEHLRRLKSVLENDLSKFNKFNYFENPELIRKSFYALLGITYFLIEIDEKLLENLDFCVSTETNENELKDVCKQRAKILSILETYLLHFDSFVSDSNDGKSSMETYVICKYYYDVIDVAATLIFFDNIHLLKEKLSLKNSHEYEQIESAFFIIALNWITFDEKVKKIDSFRNFCSQSKCFPYEVAQRIRMSIKDKIRLFSDILGNLTVDEHNLRKGIPIIEFKTVLDSHPEIKHYLLTERLCYYMEAVTTIKVVNKKASFIIERVLQVLGEYMKLKPGKGENFMWFMSLYMPKNIRSVLHKLRNKLTHLDSNSTHAKFNYEENFSKFKGIQSEIIQIYNYLQPLLYVFNSRMKHSVKKTLCEMFQKLDDHEECKRRFEHNVPQIVKNILDSSEEYFKGNALSAMDNYMIVFEIFLDHLDGEESIVTTSFETEKQLEIMKCVHEPLIRIVEWIQDIQEHHESTLLKISERAKKCFSSTTLNDFLDVVKMLKIECTSFISQSKYKINYNNSFKRISDITNLDKFFRALKSGPPILNVEEVTLIRCYLPQISAVDLEKKKIIENSVKNDFFLSKEELAENKLSYLLQEEWESLLLKYETRSAKALDIIKTPEEKLDIITFASRINKNQFQWVKDMLQFPDESEVLKKFEKLLHGISKNKRNNLIVLENRVSNLLNILIFEKNDIHESWNQVIEFKNVVDEQLLKNKIISYYRNSRRVQLSTEILLMDCMDLFPAKTRDLWKKPSCLYSGINVHNVLAHGHIILEKLSEFLDPNDLESNIIDDALQFMKDFRCISAINCLYKKAGNEFAELENLLKNKDAGQYVTLRDTVLQCPNFKRYLNLLPDAPEFHFLETNKQTKN